MKFKRVGKNGCISIPRDIAAKLDMTAGRTVDLTATNDGKLIISRHIDTCRFCGAAENVKPFGDIIICQMCAAKLYEEVNS